MRKNPTHFAQSNLILKPYLIIKNFFSKTYLVIFVVFNEFAFFWRPKTWKWFCFTFYISRVIRQSVRRMDPTIRVEKASFGQFLVTRAVNKAVYRITDVLV